MNYKVHLSRKEEFTQQEILKKTRVSNGITVLRPALKNCLSANKFAWLKNKKAKKYQKV